MAIIKCPDCKMKASDQAVSCPHCGFPLSTLSDDSKEPISKPIDVLRTVTTLLTLCQIIFLAIIIINLFPLLDDSSGWIDFRPIIATLFLLILAAAAHDIQLSVNLYNRNMYLIVIGIIKIILTSIIAIGIILESIRQQNEYYINFMVFYLVFYVLSQIFVLIVHIVKSKNVPKFAR